jgi:M6 family metalloprotease-like protein
MKLNFTTLVFCLLFLQCITAFQKADAVTANPNPVQYTQPDGSVITLQMRGDEFIHWATTIDGFMILSAKSGFYDYAMILPDGKLGFSGVIVHDPGHRSADELGFVSSIQPGLFFSAGQIREMKNALTVNHSPAAPTVGGFPTTGVRAHLMILANFNNTSTTYSQTQFNNLMNQVGYSPNGSFRDYYIEVSYGLLTVNTTVTIWVTLPHTHDYYGPQSMWGVFAYDAIVAADQQAGVNYALYDNDNDGYVDGVCIAHQGRGQEESGNINDIWSHSWDLISAGYTTGQITFDGVKVNDYTTIPEKGSASTMTTIGVMCHEFGHNLGTFDFYDTDDNTGGYYDGTGEWDIMAGGSWNGNPAGSQPAHHNAWTKAYFTWTNPTILSTQQNVLLRKAENYTDVIRYNTTTSNEYFLCENRQQTGFDASIPGHGMIIYHVDGNYITAHMGSNDINAGAHQGMYPMAANSTTQNGIMLSGGMINTSGCPWPGTTNKTTFTDATTPWSKSWANANTAKPLINIAENTTTKEVTFCFISCTTSGDPTNFTATPVSSTQINLGWTKDGANDPVMVAYNLTNTFGTPLNGTTYIAGNTISGGGTVLYNGPNTSYNHTGLTPNTTYYYKAWSVMTGTAYSTGVTANATTQSGSATLGVTPSNQNVPATPAGATSFTVTSNSAWTTVSDQTWCTVTPSGTGNGTITANYSVNTLTSSRVANITTTVTGLSPVVVTVTQAGDVATLSVTPPNQDVTTPAGQTSFAVTSNSSWTVSSDQTWCVPTTSGSGNGTIYGNYAENTTVNTRVANLTVTVSGLTPVVVTVTQSGQAPVLSVTPPNRDVTNPAGSTSFTVTSNSDWTVISDQTWCLTTPSGTGNGTIAANYSQNPASAQRTATITVTVSGVPPNSVTVTQAGTVGIQDITDEDIILMPNPNNGLFSIKADGQSSKVLSVTIFDNTGKSVLSKECKGSTSYDFDLRQQAKGEYFVSIKCGKKVAIKKVVVK